MTHISHGKMQNMAAEMVREHMAGHRRPVLYICGLNHVRAPIALREHFALAPERTAELIRGLRGAGLAEQILILSTCNRTEIYAFSPQPGFSRGLREAFLNLGGLAADTAEADTLPLYEYEGLEAVRHLFAVGAGLDSQILGENQIKQQLTQAFEICRAAGGASGEMNRLVEAALRAGKLIRTETELNEGTLNVAIAAVLKGEQTLGALRGKVCMIIGAGKVGRIAARAISERHPARLWIVNRTVERAAEIAGEIGAEAHDLDSLNCLLPEAEFILGAAYAPEMIMDRAFYERHCPPGCHPERVCIVDAAIPRIIDPALADVEGVALFDIEDMEEITEENRRRRAVAARQAWTIVEEEVEKFVDNFNQILSYVDKLNELDTQHVPPTFHVFDLENVVREDVVKPWLSQEEAMSNAPRKRSGFFSVPKVISSET